MKYIGLKDKKSKLEIDNLLSNLRTRLNSTYLEKKEDVNFVSDRKNLKKDIAKVLTFKNSFEYEGLNDK